jgi:glutamate-ammonia-ligase adenylyltransferase
MTLVALQALRDHGYVGRRDADQLADAYRWLRYVEHRLQLQRLRRTHTIPSDEAGRRWIARASGFVGSEDFDAARARWAGEVRRLHEKLFYRPLLDFVARLPTETTLLSPEQARERLVALGFSDPDGALSHLTALTRGMSRRAEMQRALLPVMLGWFADYADPDAGLLAFRKVSETLGDTPWYLRMLRDEGAVAQRLARVLSTSRYATELLSVAPAAMKLLVDDASLVPRPREELAAAMAVALDRAPSWEDAVPAARALRRVELFRVACADLLGNLDVDTVGTALTDAAAVTIGAALRIAEYKVAQERGRPLDFRIAVIALGRLGGGELSYASDADVVFVHEPDPGVDESDVASAARAVALETKRLLAQPAPDPPLVIDAGLRPEGRQGALTRSYAAYVAYYDRWSSGWEAQALLRAAPLAGDEELATRLLREVVDPARYPQRFGSDQVREVRRLKARMEAERLSAGQRARNVKLGPGGLSDVEWTVQLLQLRYAHERPALRVTGTMAALRAAAGEGLIDAADVEVLRAAWTIAARVRNAVTLVSGKPSDLVPAGATPELAGVAQLLGYPLTAPSDLLEDLRGKARRARAVVDRLFYQDGV